MKLRNTMLLSVAALAYAGSIVAADEAATAATDKPDIATAAVEKLSSELAAQTYFASVQTAVIDAILKDGLSGKERCAAIIGAVTEHVCRQTRALNVGTGKLFNAPHYWVQKLHELWYEKAKTVPIGMLTINPSRLFDQENDEYGSLFSKMNPASVAAKLWSYHSTDYALLARLLTVLYGDLLNGCAGRELNSDGVSSMISLREFTLPELWYVARNIDGDVRVRELCRRARCATLQPAYLEAVAAGKGADLAPFVTITHPDVIEAINKGLLSPDGKTKLRDPGSLSSGDHIVTRGEEAALIAAEAAMRLTGGRQK